MKKIPMRMCVVTRERYPKMELLRIVKTSDGIVVDKTGKVNGHGCYIKRDIEVLNKARKNKILNRIFECDIDESIYEEIEKNIY